MNGKYLRCVFVLAAGACLVPSTLQSQDNIPPISNELTRGASISLPAMMARAILTNPALKAVQQMNDAELTGAQSLGAQYDLLARLLEDGERTILT